MKQQFLFVFFLAFFILILACRPQDPETRRMVKRLRKFNRESQVRDNFFANDLRFRYFDSTRKADSKNLKSWFNAGNEAIRAGFNDDAIGIFDTLLQKMIQLDLSDEKVDVVKAKLALAYLRKGEIDNCLHNHSAASCILPLKPAGFHVVTYGSANASSIYHELLNKWPANLEYRWLYNIAQFTLGTDPDAIKSEWRIDISPRDSEYASIRSFKDVAARVGASINGLSGGCVLDDFNNDGILDIFASSWGLGDQLHYLEASVKGKHLTYVDKTIEAGLEGITGGLNIIQADYDNDGWQDLLVLRGAWLKENGKHPNSLIKNLGSGKFTDVTESAQLLTYHPTQTAVWRDFNNDGWLDLFIGNEAISSTEGNGCELFINQQDGTFKNLAYKAGVTVNRYVKGVAAADYDRDGSQDIYVSTLYGKNYLFKNLSSTEEVVFEEVSEAAGLDQVLESFPCWFWDYDNDGWQDIFVNEFIFEVDQESGLIQQVAAEYSGLPHQGGTGHIFRNKGDGTFEEVTAQVGMHKVAYTMGSNYGDLNNDGWLDIYLGTGEPALTGVMPNRAFINQEGHGFQEVTAATGLGHIQKGHAVAFGDLDNDGDQDIYTVLGGAFSGDTYFNALFENPLNQEENTALNGNWITLELEGTKSNRNAIGAMVSITFEEEGKGRIINRMLSSGGSFGSGPLRIEAGLGKAKKIEQVTVVWPGQPEPQYFSGLKINQSYLLKENRPKPEALNRSSCQFQGNALHDHQGHTTQPPI